MSDSTPSAGTAEAQRLHEADSGAAPWRRWGTYVSDRQWGTVREDYSADGDAWAYLSHDAARSRAYRWGEDALGGWCDSEQRLCLGIALWNGADPILKERLFGLTNAEGNHGEDVKEIYYYLDATPTHSWARMLYKYPQAAFPYAALVAENRRRGKQDPEFELIDTGVFDHDCYFDVEITYAKAGVDDVLMHITVTNRGPEPARLHVLPQIWFRNTWSWVAGSPKPSLDAVGHDAVRVVHPTLGVFTLHYEAPQALLFCENETNGPKLFGFGDPHGHYKDAFHAAIVDGDADAVNPGRTGTKAAGLHILALAPGASATVRARLTRGERDPAAFADFDTIMQQRAAEADAFYAGLQRTIGDEDARRVHRQALAGLLWSKQYYGWDVPQWLAGDPAEPAPPRARRHGRNCDWGHFNAADVISMPDKWEYPWFAAWDWAFHLTTLALVDPHTAKQQLVLLCRPWFMHPNGQLPAYEWNFGDVNPPVHAWAAWRIYDTEKTRTGTGDRGFLERVFIKLLLNFTWWVNRKDPSGRNVFQGGFLGLDNIGVFDRSKPLPVDGTLTQSDGTSWMAMFCLDMLRIALELAQEDGAYQDIATKFFEHFMLIGGAMTNLGGEGLGLWDDEDEFYYDWLITGAGEKIPVRLRSMVGLIPLFAVAVIDETTLARVPRFTRRMEWFLKHRPEIAALVSFPDEPGAEGHRLLAIARAFRMKRVLARMLDESEFLSDFGVRAISRVYRDQPYEFVRGDYRAEVRYMPAESDSELFGGNSNWRGPIWMPVNYLMIESLAKFGSFYGDDFKIECPTGSGVMLSLREIADELRRRLLRIFLRDAQGRRPVFGACETLQTNPHFRDHIWFHEYFDGDTGRGVGASHQTGWSALVANLLEELHGK
ncbi:MGH1-like glycoside hydrolase domain-containing protein [Rhodoplanes elegans]|uniref:MGH1-like glycoside hydrolase domain-containing protein n=1 Tax=Rhodoplanes elegans TaxID=29408 RepID=UPI00191379A9|nr:glucosidase [Rhodoplanes elegans]